MKDVQLLCLDVKNKSLQQVHVGCLEDYHKFLNCSVFDVTSREIAGQRFDIYCDDEGLFADRPVVSAVQSDGSPALVGNLIFAQHDREGNTVSLSKNEVDHLMRHFIRSLAIMYPVDY